MLGHSQVAALTKYFAAQISTINAQCIISAITDLGIILRSGFNIGANTTIPD
jgi:hypothetical protein